MTELLADHTTLRLGGPIDQLLTHTEADDWLDLVHTARRHTLPPFILGGGSNTIAADAGYPGPVIRVATRGIRVLPVDDESVDLVVQAGEALTDLVEFAAEEGLAGIEYLAGIPGTVGAAPVQNTGAYGQQISDTLTAVTAYDWRLDTTAQIPGSACGLSYRNSLFKKHGHWTILAVTLRLHRSTSAGPVTYGPLAQAMGEPLGSSPNLTGAVAAVRADRCARGLSLPDGGPDARQVGSVFMNPTLDEHQAAYIRRVGGPLRTSRSGRPQASAGWLLEHLGCTLNMRLAEGIYCSTRRTLTVVAREQATTAALLGVLVELSEKVHEATGIKLLVEPVTAGGTLAAEG